MFVAWWHQAITWTKVDLSSKVVCGIHLRAIQQKVLMNLNCVVCPKITHLKLQPQLLGANDLSLHFSHLHHFYVEYDQISNIKCTNPKP